MPETVTPTAVLAGMGVLIVRAGREEEVYYTVHVTPEPLSLCDTITVITL
jgi:hypothetical protein